MMTLTDFLRSRLDTDGFTTEDALSSFLPLAREVLDTHAAGMVAPLDGIGDLNVDGVRIWFEESKRRELRGATSTVRGMGQATASAVEVISETRITTELDDGSTKAVNLVVGDPDQPVTRPIYLSGYQSWEHRLDCHDPLTDIFSLGMILASMACGLDFHDTEDLATFAHHRKNLFALVPKLHPVVARVIVRMTELDRRTRSQELASLVRTLETYRDQEVDFEFDLARSAGFEQSSKRDKQTVILSKLRERLFEISRRNKLLHFVPNMQSVNLTHASVPLSFDIKSIRPEQLLTWSPKLQEDLVSGKPLGLNKYLNFAEVLYLPSHLERLISEAKRDQAEFGFAQLRLVACFLHWSNLKEKPVEQFDSPLVLVPVQLRKKKGIRDTYFLEAVSSEAEINPVVRHQFKQLYNIHLPEVIDLAKESLDDLFETLARQIAASESAITLAKIARPRIALIHEKARRKLDQYRRKARLAGRGVRKFLNLDYSYDPANFHPLGVKLFSAKIRPPQTHLRDIIEDKPRPRNFAVADDQTPIAEKERQFFSLQGGGESNPYEWTFDLCTVTLANFKYRRMSLVRDYEALLAGNMTNPAFEAAFSLTPRPLAGTPLDTRPLAERFDVVPCDPTQARAIAEAAVGRSFIIQGPPGTGKSQTITNLIADYVARGKRVLFVCEKRAAIDVVFARLRQCGLANLCCLIHDSQTDKKEFVMDLKQTYERLLASPNKKAAANDRGGAVKRLNKTLAPLTHFDAAMHTDHASIGTSVRRLLDRCIELRDARPELDVLAKESLPPYSDWLRSRGAIHRFEKSLREAGDEGVLARHPLRFLSPRLASQEHPLEHITSSATEARGLLDDAEQSLARCGISRDRWEQPAQAALLVEYASKVKALADAQLLRLFDRQSVDSQWLAARLASLAKLNRSLADAEKKNEHWIDKLNEAETSMAIDQTRAFEASRFAWLMPSWWRLRRTLHLCYGIEAHKIRPKWSQVLQLLADEHRVRHERNALLGEAAEHFGLQDASVEPLLDNLADMNTWLPDQPQWILSIHTALIKSPQAGAIVEQITTAGPAVNGALQTLRRISDNAPSMSFVELGASLDYVRDHLDTVPQFLECLRELAATPVAIADALRTLPYAPRQVEAAIADHALTLQYRQDKQLERFTSQVHRTQSRRLEHYYDHWLHQNAGELRQRVGSRFRANVHVSEQSATKLSADNKELKQRYSRGRRELEHEFGKQMRYKAIRDLVSDESGDVINDLKPIWLMSPLSVSDTLPLSTDRFDVVIFDEASQITLEEAVPALFRAPQCIIVGDEMQLPPTDFFSSKQSVEDEDELLIESDGELVRYDLDSGSFLSHAANNLPWTMLGWHYRSRSESLISFSNWAFYDGRLLTVPEESLAGISRSPIVASEEPDGVAAAAATLDRPISFHRLLHGVYDKRRNRAEADYIASMVRELLLGESRATIGIVAFSEAQQAEIDQSLSSLASEDKEFRDALEAEFEREDDGQFVGLLVKNLENIQGDERDIIILSICYGPPPTGKMRMNFGPINKSGGEKRLNVAFSRAKQHMAVVSSIGADAITNDYNDGANCLKNYLRYAESISAGDSITAARVTGGLSRAAAFEAPTTNTSSDILGEQLAEALEQAGYHVDRQVGQSHFRCDLAVYQPGDAVYRLGILIDGDAYYEQSDLVERDMMRPRLLRSFGWRIAHVFAKDWYEDPTKVLTRLTTLLASDGNSGEDFLDDEPEEGFDDVDNDDVGNDDEHQANEQLDAADSRGELHPSSTPTNREPLRLDLDLDPASDSDSDSTPASGSVPASAVRRFELVDGKSSKFWEISIAGNAHTVTFGRIGTKGQSQTKPFADAGVAMTDYQRLVAEKVRKGYREVSGETL